MTLTTPIPQAFRSIARSHHFATLLLLATLLTPTLLTATPSLAASLDEAKQVAGTAAAADSATAPFAVEVRGEGAPVLLIPGLGNSGSVWLDTADALVASGYQTHVFTLAGFAGQPALEGEFLPRVRQALADYARGLDGKPAIIGHSLGGTMALWLGATETDLFGPLIAVDGVAFLPALQDPAASADSARPAAERFHAMLAGMSQDAFEQQTAYTLSTMITDPEDARRVATASRGSQPQAVAAAVLDLMTRDLRDDLVHITSPVLLLAAGASAPTDESSARLLELYQAQVAAVPAHRVVMVKDARHYIMIDQPQRFLELVHEHLGTVARATNTAF